MPIPKEIKFNFELLLPSEIVNIRSIMKDNNREWDLREFDSQYLDFLGSDMIERRIDFDCSCGSHDKPRDGDEDDIVFDRRM